MTLNSTASFRQLPVKKRNKQVNKDISMAIEKQQAAFQKLAVEKAILPKQLKAQM